MAIHVSGHFAVLNSAMLKLAGIGPATLDPIGGAIRREADGKTPDGVLEEAALFAWRSRFRCPRMLDAGIDALVAGERIYVANGITTAQDGRVMPESWPAPDAAAKRGALPIDTVALVSFERDWPEAIRAQMGKRLCWSFADRRNQADGRRVAAGPHSLAA